MPTITSVGQVPMDGNTTTVTTPPAARTYATTITPGSTPPVTGQLWPRTTQK